MNTKADCCSNPSLRIIEAIPDESNAQVSLQKCDTCRAYWQVVVDQVISEQGEMFVWDWFQPLTDEQAEVVLSCMALR